MPSWGGWWAGRDADLRSFRAYRYRQIDEYWWRAATGRLTSVAVARAAVAHGERLTLLFAAMASVRLMTSPTP
jgi:hypothetical protein